MQQYRTRRLRIKLLKTAYFVNITKRFSVRRGSSQRSDANTGVDFLTSCRFYNEMLKSNRHWPQVISMGHLPGDCSIWHQPKLDFLRTIPVDSAIRKRHFTTFRGLLFSLFIYFQMAWKGSTGKATIFVKKRDLSGFTIQTFQHLVVKIAFLSILQLSKYFPKGNLDFLQGWQIGWVGTKVMKIPKTPQNRKITKRFQNRYESCSTFSRRFKGFTVPR